MVDTDHGSSPLRGLRVLVTRPEAQAASLSSLLSQTGATPVEVPLISIQPCEDTDGTIQHTLASLRDYHWLVFTSVNGVEIFFQRLHDFGLSKDMLQGRSIAAIGPATAQALQQRGLPVDLMPQEHLTSGIVRAMGGLELHGKRVLLPRAEEGSRDLPPGLEALGAEVTHISLYRTEIPHDAGARVQKALRAGLDVATFTSPSAVRSIITVLQDRMELLAPIVLAYIGPVTAEAARRESMDIDVVASEHTGSGLVKALCDHYKHGRI